MSQDPLSIVGQVVAEKYHIEQLVGEGGFAVVYRAEHSIWKQPVAIKFFNGLSSAPKQQRDELLDQFIQEGKLLTELSSKTVGIVQARDVGSYVTPDGAWMPYMVLEWLDGAPLDAVLHNERQSGAEPWSVPEVIGFFQRVLPILEVAHSAGVCHRDIKPANFFVLGEARHDATKIKLLDFGVAKMVADNTHMKAALAKTGMGITSFTPQYGAPEQFSRAHGATGPWTDVYALALVAVELLTGQEALQGDDLVQLGFATGDPSRRPTPARRGVARSPALEAVFERALAVAPEQRFASAAEFLGAVNAAQFDLATDGKTLLAPERAPTLLAAQTGGGTSRFSGTAQPTSVEGSVPKASLGKGAMLAAALIAVTSLGVVGWRLTAADGSEHTPNDPLTLRVCSRRVTSGSVRDPFHAGAAPHSTPVSNESPAVAASVQRLSDKPSAPISIPPGN
jgi:serine/threonine protein kinase